jgi:hypothetical protein
LHGSVELSQDGCCIHPLYSALSAATAVQINLKR